MKNRSDVLKEADNLIVGDRNNAYGPPMQDFYRTAQLWNLYLNGRTEIKPHDVAAMMVLLKVSRLSWRPDNPDSWVDIAGYAACGFECMISEEL
jgi:hypothetical protein